MIRLNLLGDVLNSMTAVDALHDRFPQAQIDMLTLPYTAAIPRQCPYVHEVLTLDTMLLRSPRALLRPDTYRQLLCLGFALRRPQYDLCVSLYGLMASIWASISGATRRIGYQGEGLSLSSLPIRYRAAASTTAGMRCSWDLDRGGGCAARPPGVSPRWSFLPTLRKRMAARCWPPRVFARAIAW